MKRHIVIIFTGLLMVFSLFILESHARLDPVVELDLEEGELSGELPFDTPFSITVKANPDIEKIEVRWRDINSPLDLKDKIKWRQMERVLTRMKIRLPMLKPNHFFKFYFRIYRKLSNEIKKELKEKINKRVDAFLRGIKETDFPSVDELIKEIIDKLPDSIPPEINGIPLKIEEGSIFDKDNGKEKRKDLKNRVNSLGIILNLQEPQVKKNEIIKRFKEKRRKLISALEKFTGNKVLSVIYDKVYSDQKAWKHLQDGAKTTQKLYDLDIDSIKKIAWGLISFMEGQSFELDPEAKMKSYWSPDDCTDQMNILNRSLLELRFVRSILRRILQPNAFSSFKGPSINQIAMDSLIKDVETARDQIIALLNDVARLQKTLIQRKQMIERVVNKLIPTQTMEEFNLRGDTSGDFATRAKRYISADVGFAVAPDAGEIFPYLGVNIYFRPINKEVPLKFLKKRKGNMEGYRSTMGHRLSFMIGISVSSLEKEGERKNLFNKNALMVGAGYRIFDALRLGTGLLVFKSIPPAPSNSSPKIDFTWFLSASLDWDIRKTLGGLGKLIGAGS